MCRVGITSTPPPSRSILAAIKYRGSVVLDRMEFQENGSDSDAIPAKGAVLGELPASWNVGVQTVFRID